MYFELWASGGPAWAAVPSSSGLARHETGPRARGWAAGRARGLARHDLTLYWAGPGAARLRAGQAGLVLGPGWAARMAMYRGGLRATSYKPAAMSSKSTTSKAAIHSAISLDSLLNHAFPSQGFSYNLH